MAKYFLGSVGKAEAFKMTEHGLELAFVSKTLTDSGLNISTTKDDIRGGQGAPIQFSFYHDASVEITLTDIQFKTEYVTAQLGAEFDKHPQAYKTEKMNLSTTAVAIDAKPLPIACDGNEKAIVWASKPGSEDWFVLDKDTSGYKLPAGKEAGEYCVRYLADDHRARVAEITSNIIPSELYLIITAPIFAGDACAASRGKAAGEIQFDVPRFLLNGGQEFSMNMSSNQTMSLAGIALASVSEDCEVNGGSLLKIREVIYSRTYESIEVDPECLKVGLKPEVYGITNDGFVSPIDNDELEFDPELSNGKFSEAGSTTIKYGSLTKTVQVLA